MTSDELKGLRKKHGLSVTQAARLVHVADRTWQRYESGRQDIPGAIIELFKIKVSDAQRHV
jgi:predicted transcriptional regulator